LPVLRYGFSRLVVISSVKQQHHHEGRTLRKLAKERKQPLYDAIFDLLHEEDAAVLTVAHVLSEEDVRTVLKHPATIVGSDSMPLTAGKPHPRTYGTFARVLGVYVRDNNLWSLEEAVHRMTSLGAKKFGLTDRGVLKPGAMADVVIFDPVTVRDRATYEQPRQHPAGILHVFVSGQRTVQGGVHNGARAGRVLHRARAR
jgi:N-acyl-D-aspartate/D-glutamate deacylase